ncbi:hypothetical protein H0O00_05785 [Candidatus Micrarchaeota archaeon]|nr:hypothetical protein [Candidatus Micrarchaeota archaeon]
MAKPRESLLEKGDQIEVNGQTLAVLGVSDGADSRTIYMSDDYMLRIRDNKSELFKCNRLSPDMEDIRAVPLSSLRIMKKS